MSGTRPPRCGCPKIGTANDSAPNKYHGQDAGRGRVEPRHLILGRKPAPRVLSLTYLREKELICQAIAPNGFKCAGREEHDGLHYCTGTERWEGHHPNRRGPAPIPPMTGAALEAWRLELGLSRIECERRLGINRGGQKWERWETGNPPGLLSYIAYWLPALPDARKF